MSAPDDDVAAGGYVGVFWSVDGKLIWERVTRDQAEVYGEFLTSRGHYSVWSDWQDLSAKERRIKDVPETVAFSEYEDHPRGRVVFHSASKTFIIYADRRLQREETVSRLVEVCLLYTSDAADE